MFKNSDKGYIVPEKKEYLLMTVKSVFAVVMLDVFFYREVWAAIFLTPVGIAYFLLQKRLTEDKHRAQLRKQFKELLMLSSTLQRAGYSTENSILESHRDLSYMFGDDSAVCGLVKEVALALKNKRSAGEVFIRVGRAVDMDEIEEFGHIYEIAYKKSGNMSLVMDKAAGSIIEKTEVENDIYVSVSKGRFEMRIMNMMPFMIMAYISLTGRGYFDVLYHNMPGALVMSICLLVYILSYVWGEKIVSVKV